MKVVLLLTSLLTLSSCLVLGVKTEEVIIENDEVVVNEESKPQRPYRVDARIGKFPESDPIEIISSEIAGNTLFLEVNYSGGCALHEFDFIGDPAIMKSNPPKRNVMLEHKANNDSCEELVAQKIEVDLTELAITETPGSEIILLLKGYKSPLKYIYE